MLCKYKYITKDKKECGEYQCDTDDLRKLLKTNPNVECLIATLENGEQWILYKKIKWTWEPIKISSLPPT